ncbi:hypothetical protein CRYUN_Cryun09bG0116800 [Craigia yunnanensis]
MPEWEDWRFSYDVARFSSDVANTLFPRLRRLIINNCPKLSGELPSYLPSLEKLVIYQCEQLVVSIPSLPMLNELKIDGCKEVVQTSKVDFSTLDLMQLSNISKMTCLTEGFMQRLTKNVNIRNTCLLEELTIKSCPFLTCLSAKGELPVTLQYLKISLCTTLETVTSRGKLPSALKHLEISSCSKLESMAKKFQKDSSLEYISIWDCGKLKSLPECLYNLNNLKIFYVGTLWTFVSFPEGGFPAANLRLLWISSCDNLEALPNCFHKLTSLQRLVIAGFPSIISFPQEGLPPNLTSLEITGHKICKPLFEWGLHKLASLKGLIICRCQDVDSFPLEEIGMKLPTSLTWLEIEDFPNLRYLSPRGFRNLNSLARLRISDCPKLTSLPKDGLPPSLLLLSIFQCPLLEEHCKRNKGLERFKIAHIPHVKIGHGFIHDREEE